MIEGLLTFFSVKFALFNAYAQTNQMVAGAVSLWGLGVVSFLAKDIPSKIYNFINRHLTTELVLMSSNQIHHDFLRWYVTKGYVKNSRSLKANSGHRWSEEEGVGEKVNSLGYGVHWFWYKKSLLYISLIQEDSKDELERDRLTIKKFGRSHKVFNILLKELISQPIKEGYQINYEWSYSNWEKLPEQRSRPIESIYLNQNIKKNVTEHLDTFLNSEEWYISKNIPYQTGILLYGKPGTGKTSLIKGLSNKYNLPLYIFNTSDLKNIKNAMQQLPLNCILVIEDIDTNSKTHNRDSQDEVVDNDIKPFGLSDLLNCIDGINTCHGRIMIITSNRIEKLDEALIRPGRIDLKLDLGCVNLDVLRQVFKVFYPSHMFDDFEIKEDLVVSELQNIILMNLESPENVLKKIKCVKL